MPVKDSLIAATALTHGVVVVTRNRKDFEPAGVEIVNPFVSKLMPLDRAPCIGTGVTPARDQGIAERESSLLDLMITPRCGHQ